MQYTSDSSTLILCRALPREYWQIGGTEAIFHYLILTWNHQTICLEAGTYPNDVLSLITLKLKDKRLPNVNAKRYPYKKSELKLLIEY